MSTNPKVAELWQSNADYGASYAFYSIKIWKTQITRITSRRHARWPGRWLRQFRRLPAGRRASMICVCLGDGRASTACRQRRAVLLRLWRPTRRQPERILHMDKSATHRVSKKPSHFHFQYSSITHGPILIICGMQHRKETWCKWLKYCKSHTDTVTTLPCEIQKLYFGHLQQRVQKIKKWLGFLRHGVETASQIKQIR